MNPDSLIEKHFRLIKTQATALKKLGLFNIRDLLFYFPARYGVPLKTKSIAELRDGDHALIYGRIENLKKTRAFRKKIPMTQATLEDVTGKISLVWFHQPYIAEIMKNGSLIALKGKVSKKGNGLSMINPDSEGGVEPEDGGVGSLLRNGTEKSSSTLQPTYPESRGITSRWFHYRMQKILNERVHEKIEDQIPAEILKKYNLPSLHTSLIWIHLPQKESDARAARKRFAFEEIFFIQLSRLKNRVVYQENPSFQISHEEKQEKEFVDRFPFTLTSSQQKAIDTIVADFKKERPMIRLLEGDVGSGKTAVAATTAYTVVTSRPNGSDGGKQDFGNLQTAIMAPTEILAKQHFESFIELFSHLPIQIGLITGTGCKKFPSKVDPTQATSISRAQLLKWVANGEIPIVIGTHSLIQKTVKFKHLAYVIIDEQHRFGTMQRSKFFRKEESVPHLLSMTATPIPRTLALTVYGDLDLTLLTDMPPGRKPIITEIVAPRNREKAYVRIREELKNGRQAYIVCPRIDEPDPEKLLALNVRSVKAEATRLKKEVFPEYEIEILHSKMRPKERDEVMERFASGEIHILVATSVVEVGVNIPNATSIIIEGADRFGLAQLHQLRGRVLRSTHQAYCFVFTDSKGVNALKRLKALKQAKNGFELAEYDLKQRGSGVLSGKKQWGITDIGMDAIKNIKMVEAARIEAQSILKKDPELKKYPLIKARIENAQNDIHFE